MKTSSFFGVLGALVLTTAAARGQIIAQWDFNSTTPDASTSTGSSAPSMGSGTATLLGGVTGAFAAGSPADPAATDNTAWSLSSWPAQGTASGTAGAQFMVSTAGFAGQITVALDLRQSATASERFQLQYTTDGVLFQDVSGGTASFGATGNNTATSFSSSGLYVNTAAASSQAFVQSLTYTFLAGSEAAANALFGFRLVSVFEGNSYDASGAAASYGTTGTLRLDGVTVSHLAAVPEPATSALLLGGIAALGALMRRRQSRTEILANLAEGLPPKIKK